MSRDSIVPLKIFYLGDLVKLKEESKLCAKNKILNLLGFKRGFRPSLQEIIAYLDSYAVNNNLYIYNRKIIQPDDKLSDALDYDEFVDDVIRGHLAVNYCANMVYDYRLNYTNINLLLSEKCNTIPKTYNKIFNLVQNIIIFLNKRDINIYLIMEILDEYDYSLNFTEYELFHIIRPLLPQQ